MIVKAFFLNLRIRIKLLIAFMSILMMSVILIGVALYSLDKILTYKNLNGQVDNLNLRFLELNKQAQSFVQEDFKEPAFLLKGESESLDKYNQILDSMLMLVDELEAVKELKAPHMINILANVRKDIRGYDEQFQNLRKVLKERGFRDHGREGLLREAIHKVEDSGFPYDKVQMLMLRRHEKDFFMRKDIKYLGKFNTLIAQFKLNIQAMQDSSYADFVAQKARILQLANNYQQQFNQIVELEREIGLAEFDGLKGKMNSAYLSLGPQLEELNIQIKSRTKKLITETVFYFVGLFLFQLILGFILMMFYSKVFTRAIKEIKEAAVSLSSGHYPEKIQIRTRDELGETKKAFNNLIKRIRAAADFATRLGNGELEAKYQEKYSNDVLARAIISMQDKLLLSEKEQAKVNWSNQGMVLFNEILKGDHENKELVADKLLRQLIKYLNANQGALFLLDKDGDRQVLRRMASFAYGKKKYITHTVEIGESLLGEAVLEKDTILLTEIPQGYTSITSGLGESTPSSILIVPLKVQEHMVGVIELASFQVMEAHEIKFLEKLSESMANLFANKKIEEETRRLLEESQEKAEMLAAQEEELRQNTEELHATQEDMKRKTQQLSEEIESLKLFLQQKDEENTELLSKLAIAYQRK